MGSPIQTAFTVAQLAQAVPANIESQDVSSAFPLPFWSAAGDLPDSIPVDPTPGPVFTVQTTQYDWFRIGFLLLGVIVGAKILKG